MQYFAVLCSIWVQRFVLEGCGHYSLLYSSTSWSWSWVDAALDLGLQRPPNDQHQHHGTMRFGPEHMVPRHSMVSISKRQCFPMFPTKMILNWDLIIFRYTETSYFSLGMCEFDLKSAAEIAVVQWCVWNIWWCKTLVWHERWGWIWCYLYIYTYTYYVYDFAMQKLWFYAFDDL